MRDAYIRRKSEYHRPPPACRGAGSIDAAFGDKATPAYRAGVAALRRWHALCEKKRANVTKGK